MRIYNILRITQECPSFNFLTPSLRTFSSLFSSLSTMDVMNPVQTPFHSLKLSCNNIMLQLNVSFKHLSGLSVYKVLTVTVVLTRTVQYMSKYFLQCNVSSLAERRRTCCHVTEADSHKRQVGRRKKIWSIHYTACRLYSLGLPPDSPPNC